MQDRFRLLVAKAIEGEKEPSLTDVEKKTGK